MGIISNVCSYSFRLIAVPWHNFSRIFFKENQIFSEEVIKILKIPLDPYFFLLRSYFLLFFFWKRGREEEEEEEIFRSCWKSSVSIFRGAFFFSLGKPFSFFVFFFSSLIYSWVLWEFSWDSLVEMYLILGDSTIRIGSSTQLQHVGQLANQLPFSLLYESLSIDCC